jgi:hypothetical protein
MKAHIAKCGYRCDLCAAFKPVLTEAEKKDISRAFKQYFGFFVPPQDVKTCTGCQSSDEPNDKECPVFPCVRQKGIDNCAYCDDFGCGKLRQRMDVVEEIHVKQKDVPKDDFEKYFKPYLSRKTLMKIRQTLGK